MNSSYSVLNQYEISNPELLCKKPLVSVLMITYNHEPFLAEAIEGVVNQVCDFEFELIIGEDCSPDRTLSIAKEYQRKYSSIIRIITADKNVGFAENLRRIIYAARGKFSDFCEGDDYWIYSHKLSEEVKIFNSSLDIGIVHGDHVFRHDFWGKKFIVKPQGRYANDPDKSGLSGDIRNGVFPWKKLVTHTSTVSFKTTYLKEYLDMEESNFIGAFYDKCIVSYCSIKCLAGYIDRPVSAYRVWNGSIMTSGEIGILKHNFEIFKYFQLFFIKHPDIDYLIPQSSLCNYAEELYHRALLYRNDEYRYFLEKYLRENSSLSKEVKLKTFLFSHWLTALVYRQVKFLKNAYIKILHRAMIYFNFEERIEIKC